jgi:triacylglycerol lipase
MNTAMIIPKLRAPIVLVHGLLGFDKIDALGTTLVNYFPGIPELMTAAGNRVLIPFLAPTGGVAERAAQLKDFILKNSPQEPVHLFAHSMGGLDSRYMIARLDMADKVLTLTTIGTPHRGTSFADWGVDRFERIVKPILDTIGMPYQAFYDLRRANCKTFNEQVKDAPSVRYFSVAGQHDGHLLLPEWLLPHSIVKRHEGDNDGIVSIASATYGETVDVWEGDHLRLVNWFHPIIHYGGSWKDPGPRYGALLRRLADLGY